MLRLGGDHRLRVVSKQHGTDVVIVHRAPTSDEMNQYLALAAVAGTKINEEEPALKGRIDRRTAIAVSLIKDVEGLEAEEGYTTVETLVHWGGAILHAFTRQVFEVPFDVEVTPDPGKSEPPSVRPLQAASARSRDRSASGSNK